MRASSLPHIGKIPRVTAGLACELGRQLSSQKE
jgi:hypothetical protein